MREIPLAARRKCGNTGKYVALVDECDYEYLNKIAWSPLVIKGQGSPLVYAYGAGNPRPLMHRMIWIRSHGEIPEGFSVDHIEHGPFGGLNNQRSNLRLASRAGQSRNSRRRADVGVSGFRGVYWHKRGGKWAAQIHENDYPVYLGLFESEGQAALAYDNAARERFGEFARLNYPNVGGE